MDPRRLFKHLLEYLLPTVCELCQRSCRPDRTDTHLCNACRQTAFPPHTRCRQCGLVLGQRLQSFGWTRCRHCRAAPDETRTWVAGTYAPPVDALPKRLKFGAERALAVDMGLALADRFERACMTDTPPPDAPDLLLPVPVSNRRLRERGYNQALLIARSLGTALNIPVEAVTLLKTRETGRQAQLSLHERRENLNGAYRCTRLLDGLHIGLVDDVMTTGATLDACEATLRDAGAATISRWVAFRTPEQPEDLD